MSELSPQSSIYDIFAVSRFAKHVRLVDHIHTDLQRGRLYEVVDIREEGAGNTRRTPCRTQRCRDFALRVYDVKYSGETYGLDPYMLRQTQGMRLQHPRLLGIYDTDLVFDAACQDVVTPSCHKAYMLMLMELASGNLEHWLAVRRARASLDEVIRLAFDVLNGLAFLHHQGFVHRRLHPRNIMLVEERPASSSSSSPPLKADVERVVAKIGDFQDMASYAQSALPLRDEHTPYTSPEVLVGYERYSPASDMWSFGVVLCEMLMGAGRTPFADTNSDTRWFRSSQRKYVLSRIFEWLGTPSLSWRETYMRQKDVPWDAADTSTLAARWADIFPDHPLTARERPLLDLIDNCLQLDPAARLTAFAALRHPLFAHLPPIPSPSHTPLRPDAKAVIPRGPWSDLRYDILQHAQHDVESGIMQYHPTLMALYIFDRCPTLFATELHQGTLKTTPEWVYSCFCAAYLIALKMLVDLPDPLPDLFAMTKGVVCGASESNRLNVLFLERSIVQRLQCHFGTQDIAALPVTMTVFQTLRRKPFELSHLALTKPRPTGKKSGAPRVPRTKTIAER